MEVLKCKMCGGNLEVQEGMTICECEYCGSTQTIPNVDDEKKVTLFTRANRLRSDGEFDKAFGIYESIVTEFQEEAEAYWGLILCKYGIEYVDDSRTGKKIPTCHRSSFDSVMDDPNFEMVMECSDAASRAIYREEAKAIEALRASIIEVSSQEEPYDIFICYKETDLTGGRTIDSVIAQDVYDALVEKGYKVFFSRITLEDKLGQEYEPYIFAALNSAKVMLAFGTDYEYYNSVWVKNEWSRFLSMIQKGEKKTLIPCYKGIDAYDMPKEFARLQAQDMGKVGAIQDLVRGIEKLIPLEAPMTVMKENINIDSNQNVEPLLKRVFMFLEDEDWESADEYCEKVLDIEPKNAQAYLGKVMKELNVAQKELLCEALLEIEKAKSYVRLFRYADKNLKKELKYAIAKQHMRFVSGEKDYLRVASEFEELQDYKDSASLSAECLDLSKKAKEKDSYLGVLRDKAKKASKYIYAGWNTTFYFKIDRTVEGCGNNKDGQCNVEQWKDIIDISCGIGHTIGLKSDGTVVACGDNVYGQCDVDAWNDIIDISCRGDNTIGLKSDGTVVACGRNVNGRANVDEWKEIVAISCGGEHTAGLKSDGTVVACGWNNYGQCDVDKWKDIVAISCNHFHTIGLKSDGTVVACGRNNYGQCNVKQWNDIIAILCGGSTIGLKSDGTVVACGDNEDGQCNVVEWNDIIAISSGASHTIGLKSDGTVVACGNNEEGQCNVEQWNDIIAISCGGDHTIGLKSDGTIVSCGENVDGQCDVQNCRLFSNFETIEEEKKILQEKEEAKLEQIKLEERKCAEKKHRRIELESQRSILMKKLKSLGVFNMKEKREIRENIEKIEKEINLL